MWASEANTLESFNIAGRAQKLAKGELVAKLNAVGVDVLTQQGHFDGSIGHERLDLRQHFTGPAIHLFATQAWDNTKRARVVAPHRNGYPPGIAGISLGGQSRGERLQCFDNLDFGCTVVARALQQRGKRTHVVGSKDNVNIRRLRKNRRLVFLRQASTHRNLHARALPLQRCQMPQSAIELVVRVLADRASIDDHHIGQDTGICLQIPGGFKRARHSLRVVNIHLAAKGSHLIGATVGGIE